MELSPEEYGAYWRASVYVAAGIVLGFLGYRLTSPLLSHPNAGAVGLGVFLFVTVVFASTFIAMLGFARAVRTAVDAELRN
ncbi:hypothetical protein [Natronorubrum sulfidifaciens]|uniref:Solute carrier family 5 (Low affinity glucose cotransporter), member 4-like protein n=1 Tax=Natronorubrum sulfidifaciens JCM 14089 TaxID=1230460 RepID=L9W9Y2_9EURY|nr:hypothetical protein [Natronorubrum sulfidifaciens]ELY45118.1 solute carrier family 5 (low affinity glucose cotransporter), member 4-like protein [Natronorubrum sulfidifaciens JCM 14089]